MNSVASKALPAGRAFFMLLVGMALWAFGSSQILAAPIDDGMTEEEAIRLGEEFGIVVDKVDEEIRQELKLTRAQGVVVFEVIGGTPADLAGIKVRAIIKEIDKDEIRNLIDFGRALKKAMPVCNFTVATYEPADPSVQGVGGLINFHLVRCERE
ncbi:MAG: hypothetical protein ACE5NA_02705 [Nitrospiraceae bacterium]